MHALPSHLIKLRVLAEVPRSEYLGLTQTIDFTDTRARHGFLGLLRQRKLVSTIKSTRHKHTRTSEFNAAIWLNFSCPPKQPVSLWLSYKDLDGCQSVLVDEQRVEFATSIMLSGSVQLKVKGELEYLKACCGGLSDEEIFSIDELHVQRASEDQSLHGLDQKFG